MIALDALQCAERAGAGGRDDLDVPPLRQPVVARSDNVVMCRDRDVRHAPRGRVARQRACYPREIDGRGVVDAGSCRGALGRRRITEQRHRDVKSAGVRGVAKRGPRITRRDRARRRRWAGACFAARRGCRRDVRVAVVILAVKEFDVGSVVVTVRFTDLSTGRSIVPAVVLQRIDRCPAVAVRRGVLYGSRRDCRIDRKTERCSADSGPEQQCCLEPSTGWRRFWIQLSSPFGVGCTAREPLARPTVSAIPYLSPHNRVSRDRWVIVVPSDLPLFPDGKTRKVTPDQVRFGTEHRVDNCHGA